MALFKTKTAASRPSFFFVPVFVSLRVLVVTVLASPVLFLLFLSPHPPVFFSPPPPRPAFYALPPPGKQASAPPIAHRRSKAAVHSPKGGDSPLVLPNPHRQ